MARDLSQANPRVSLMGATHAEKEIFMRAILLAVSLSACATTGALDHSADATGSTSRVQLDFSARAEDAKATFPAVMQPRLPSADRIAPRLATLGGDSLSADVRLCVRPDGKVANATLSQSSQVVAFDQAMMRDVAEWQFAAMPGPATLKTCEDFTISYRPRR